MAAVIRPRLRVGVFADCALQPRWMVEALARAAAGDHAELSLVAHVPGAKPASGAPMLWRAYSSIDEAVFGDASRWSRAVDVTRLVPEERRVEIAGDDRVWRARVADARLDVAFVMGDVDDARLGNLARYGTWRFCFGEEQGTCERTAAVRDVVEGREVVASGIRIHPGGGRPDRVACLSWARTYAFSPARSRSAIFAKTVEFLARALRDLHARGVEWIERCTEPAKPRASNGYAPGLSGIATLGTRVAQRLAMKALTVEEWSIAYRFSDDESWDGKLDNWHHLHPPKGGFWADPFPLQKDGRSFIFFEELPYGAPRAHISVVEVNRKGEASAPLKVLERDYHLSYPFLIEEDGELFMIPETADNATVELYRCVEFPHKWKLERVLVEGLKCADATLHREHDRWWMFTTATRPGGADINDELHLFSAERLLGDWKPHRGNPVKSDVRSARPAGRLFRRGDALYRPGQIGAPIYGAGIALHRVERLTPDEYLEREDRRIVPATEPFLGIHTINRAGDLSVADAFRRRSRFAA